MLLVVMERKAPVGQAEHATRVGALPGEKGGAARRAGGRDAESLAKQNALSCQPLQVGRRDGVAEGLDVAPRVVRVDVDNVRAVAGGRPGKLCRAGSAQAGGKKVAARNGPAHGKLLGTATERFCHSTEMKKLSVICAARTPGGPP